MALRIGRAELLPQRPDIDAQILDIVDLVRPPDAPEQEIMGQDLAGMLG